MNDLKIKTKDEKVKVFIDDKEIKFVEKLKLSLGVGEMRMLELKCLVNNVDIETNIDKAIEMSSDITNK